MAVYASCQKAWVSLIIYDVTEEEIVTNLREIYINI